jgi:WD40 repeat protein
VISVLKRISASAISETQKFLALGCKDGGIFIYDLVADRLSKSLDKHTGEVSCLGFYKDWILCSGGLDGKVHMYDISVQDNGPKSQTMS